MSRQPLLILVTSFILGIFLQDYFLFEQKEIISVLITILVIVSLFFFKSRVLFQIRDFLLILFFFGLGIVFHNYHQTCSENFNFKSNENIVFKISKKLNSNEKYKKYEAQAQVGYQSFKTIISVDKNEKELDFTHYYKAKAYVTKPKSPEHDFQFDYSRYLSRKRIFYQCFLNDQISQAKRNDLSFAEKIRQKRLETLQTINHSKMNFRSREFLKGIILADRTEMDAETVKDFNRSGLVHFLAISGTHIAVIFGMFYFSMMSFSPVKFKKYAIVICLIFIWVFAVFIGFGNSVVRSCIMISAYFIYVLLQRKPDLLHSLALSAFIILIIDTQQIFDVGFQLSFLAVFGIYWLNQPILKLFPRQDNFFKKIVFNTISISISAQLATLPLVLYYFHQFSLISVIANFFIVPCSEIIIIFSFLMTALMGFDLNFKWIDSVYDFTIQILLKVIHWFSDFDILFFENIPLNLFEVFTLLGVVCFLRFTLISFNFKTVSSLVLAGLMFFILRISFNIWESQKNEVLVHYYKKEAVVSIKQGNKVIFLKNKSENDSEIEQYIINPYISNRRIKKIDLKRYPPLAESVKINNKVYKLTFY